MLFLAPNVYVLEYLMNTKQISGASAESAHRFIQSGMYNFLSNMRHLVFCQILVSPEVSLSEKSFLYYFLLINKYRSLVCVLFCCKALREAARARKMCREKHKTLFQPMTASIINELYYNLNNNSLIFPEV